MPSLTDALSPESEARQRLRRQFDRAFIGDRIELPAAAATYGRPGWLHQANWRVSFVWGKHSEYLEYEATWGLAGDQVHRRLWADGRVEDLDATNEFVVAAVEADVATAIAETGSYNRGIETALRSRGLYPWDDISSRYGQWAANEFWAKQDLNPHSLFAQATGEAGETIDPLSPRNSFLESKLEVSLLAALTRRVDLGLLGARKEEFKIPGWTGHLGGIDLYLRTADKALRIGCELKVDDVKWTLWDLFKLVSTFELPTVDAAFLVVGAPAKTWASDKPYTGLFNPTPGACLRWDVRDSISWCPKAWQELLDGGPARPLNLPAEVEVESVARAAVVAYPGYELRTIAVRPVPGSGRVVLQDGWPTVDADGSGDHV